MGFLGVGLLEKSQPSSKGAVIAASSRRQAGNGGKARIATGEPHGSQGAWGHASGPALRESHTLPQMAAVAIRSSSSANDTLPDTE